ncbi:MAG: KTSC domain-containing protein [Clostridia bacterium]
MDRASIESEIIRSVGYDINTRLMEVELNSGNIFQYKDVPDLVYQGLLYSPTKDSYYQTMFEDGTYHRTSIR